MITTRQGGEVIAFDEATCWGKIRLGKTVRKFHSTSFQAHPTRFPIIGDRVEAVFQDRRLIGVRVAPIKFSDLPVRAAVAPRKRSTEIKVSRTPKSRKRKRSEDQTKDAIDYAISVMRNSFRPVHVAAWSAVNQGAYRARRDPDFVQAVLLMYGAKFDGQSYPDRLYRVRQFVLGQFNMLKVLKEE